MTTKGMILDQMVQIFTRKGCHVYACNAFLNHVHILVEIPSPTDFAKIINKVKSSTGVVYRKYPEYADFSGWAAGFDSFGQYRVLRVCLQPAGTGGIQHREGLPPLDSEETTTTGDR